MFHKDGSKSSKARSHISRIAHYIRSAFGRDSHPLKKEKCHGSMDDLNRDSSNYLYSNDPSAKIGENGTHNKAFNHANSVGNLTERTSSSSAVSSNPFRDELAAKLSAGPGFPFGGGAHRLGVVAPPVTVSHSAVASGDDTPVSPSPGSPLLIEHEPRDRNLEGSTGGGGGPLQDSHTESAMLRIHLNRQRRHRARTNQSTAPVTSATPLSRIGEADTADLLGNNRHSGPQHSPLIFPKSGIRINFPSASFENKQETGNSQKIPSPKHSVGSDVETMDYMEFKTAAHARAKNPADENVFHGERKETEDHLDEHVDNEANPPKSNGAVGGQLGILSTQPSLVGEGSASQDASCSNTAKNSIEWIRNHSTGELDENFLSLLAQEQTNPPTSTPVGILPRHLQECDRIGSLSKREGFLLMLPPKTKEEVEDDNEQQEEPSISSPDVITAPNPELEGSKEESLNHQNPSPAQNVNNAPRFLTSAGEVESNRHSRVCDLVKVFQQGGAT